MLFKGWIQYEFFCCVNEFGSEKHEANVLVFQRLRSVPWTLYCLEKRIGSGKANNV